MTQFNIFIYIEIYNEVIYKSCDWMDIKYKFRHKIMKDNKKH